MSVNVEAELASSRPVKVRVGTTIPFDAINQAGAYVCNWSGHLMRIPERTVVPGETLRLNMIGQAPLTVTKISDDPSVPLMQARQLASTLGVSVGF